MRNMHQYYNYIFYIQEYNEKYQNIICKTFQWFLTRTLSMLCVNMHFS
jgi:hypothetical protein